MTIMPRYAFESAMELFATATMIKMIMLIILKMMMLVIIIRIIIMILMMITMIFSHNNNTPTDNIINYKDIDNDRDNDDDNDTDKINSNNNNNVDKKMKKHHEMLSFLHKCYPQALELLIKYVVVNVFSCSVVSKSP